MTLENRKLYIAVILAVTLVVGLSGITQAEAITYETVEMPYTTCEVLEIYSPIVGKKKVAVNVEKYARVSVGVNPEQSDEFQIKYNIPSVLEVPAWRKCYPIFGVVDLIITMSITDNHSGETRVCFNDRIDENNPLTDSDNGFPKTDGFVTVTCDGNPMIDGLDTEWKLKLVAKHMAPNRIETVTTTFNVVL